MVLQRRKEECRFYEAATGTHENITDVASLSTVMCNMCVGVIHCFCDWGQMEWTSE